MTEEIEHFVRIKLEGRSIDHVLSIRIPDSNVKDIYRAESVTFDIVKKTKKSESILKKTPEPTRIEC